LEAACELLTKYKSKAKIISGGQSLVPLLKGRYIEPKYIINLKNVIGLSYIIEENKGIRIGALTTHRTIETSPTVKKWFPVLVEAEHGLAHRQIRNWGTVGGALSHGDPGGDLGPPLIALRASIKAKSTNGERYIELENFYENIFTTVLYENELLHEVFIPYLPPYSAAAYRKEAIEEGDYPVCSVAAMITLESDKKTIKDARIVLGAVGVTPIFAEETSKMLLGKKVTPELAEECCQIAENEADPTTDVLGSAEYKKEMVRLLTRDMVNLAIERAQKSQSRGGNIR
jgi:CO/xanthine dehydrogenase FAD-binding subunit